MKNAKVIEQSDIKKILAEYFKVPESSIVKAQYSYIILESEEQKEDEVHQSVQQ